MSAYYATPVQSCSCGTDISQIEVGGFIVGIAGLRAILGAFQRAGREPDPALADELLAMVKVYNYVAPNSVEEYKTALLREYTKYWNARPPARAPNTATSLKTEPRAPDRQSAAAKLASAVRNVMTRAMAILRSHQAR